MDKSEGKDWFAKTLNSVTEETAKVYRISTIKLEIATLGRSRNEKTSVLTRKLLDLIEKGEIDANLFEPEYSAVKTIDEKRQALEEESNAIRNNIKFGFSSTPTGKKDDDNKEDNDDDKPEPEPEIEKLK